MLFLPFLLSFSLKYLKYRQASINLMLTFFSIFSLSFKSKFDNYVDIRIISRFQ